MGWVGLGGGSVMVGLFAGSGKKGFCSRWMMGGFVVVSADLNWLVRSFRMWRGDSRGDER